MLSSKLRNTGISLMLDACLASLILFLSREPNSGELSLLYVWVKLATLVAFFAGLLLLVLRIFRAIDRNRNLLYIFWGITNVVLGIGGGCFYLAGKINLIGLHETLPNLLIGVIILADIFAFDTIFRSKGS